MASAMRLIISRVPTGSVDVARLEMTPASRFPEEVEHGCRYEDDIYEYKFVYLPKAQAVRAAKLTNGWGRLLEEREVTSDEPLGLGIMQSPGWENYEVHIPELHILLLRRLKAENAGHTQSPSEATAQLPQTPAQQPGRREVLSIMRTWYVMLAQAKEAMPGGGCA
eukprot:CAMPEP_0204028708 /NCGR_PEP_ID=MMETSP0360-20130528/52852_1 /ASSEMBLY_ACC=CAM_ASM_000342 /TAXON_ID=268821 /ORGANISM="Scrippsiella Hangoei, Strain SHTV-5" /LENGTH=165 /DNA_ID=CAMNT_0050972575 /DNA_START=55 /DNA_END=549 /DNA_ORIENTATION=-